ncbi:hypothetical protein HYY69_06545 [Candidatus Woesearchaeota archaeon]|nr:hypothetical protein [Candidatus Woesearchaeota archaeon]
MVDLGAVVNECCVLGKTPSSEIVHETNNFFVTPALGQMGIEGYLLIVSKFHYQGIGEIPVSEHPELEIVLGKTIDVVKQHYGDDVVVFEHGPRIGCVSGGGCLEHSHLHLVPTDVDVIRGLDDKLVPQSIAGFGEIHDFHKKCFDNYSSYLFIQAQDGQRYLVPVPRSLPPLPSQYLRQVIARNKGIAQWDWRRYPDHETFQRTLSTLRYNFKG